MLLAGFTLLLAASAAIWLLIRATKPGEPRGGDVRNVTIFKGVVWLGIVAALFAAKLTPLALMILLAAGGVTAIEIWRERMIRDGAAAETNLPKATASKMSEEEALSILGVERNSDEAEIRAAHKKLISQLHPDKGGTDYLAAKNQ